VAYNFVNGLNIDMATGRALGATFDEEGQYLQQSGFLYDSNGAIVVNDGGEVSLISNGYAFDVNGALCIDSSETDPAYVRGGMGFDAEGRLKFSLTDDIALANAGWPITAFGALAMIGVEPPIPPVPEPSFAWMTTRGLIAEQFVSNPAFVSSCQRTDQSDTTRDHTGVMRYINNSMIKMYGCRLVENIVKTTSHVTGNVNAWASTGTDTGNAGGYEDPFGQYRAGRGMETAVTNEHSWYTMSPNVQVAGVYTFSIYVKKYNRQWAYIQLAPDAAAKRYGVVVDLDTGLVTAVGNVGSPANADYAVETVGNGWYRVSITASHTSGDLVCVVSLSNVAVPTFTSGKVSYLGVITQGIYLFGAQVERVTMRSSYHMSELVPKAFGLQPPYYGTYVDAFQYFNTLNPYSVTNHVATRSSSPTPITSDEAGVDSRVADERGPYGLMAERSVTNQLSTSDAFGSWTANNAPTVTSNNVLGPDNTLSADTIADNGATLQSVSMVTPALTAAAHVLSVFVKKTVGATTFPVVQALVGTVVAMITVDTNNGVATPWTANTGNTIAAGVAAGCENWSDSYWRVFVTFTATAAAWTAHLYPAATSNATQATGALDATVTGSAVFACAQLETGTFPTSYIHNASTTKCARNQDGARSILAQNWNTHVGTVYCQFRPAYAGALQSGGVQAFGGESAVNNGQCFVSSLTGKLSAYDGTIREGNTYTPTQNQVVNLASRWSVNPNVLHTFIDGVKSADLTFSGTMSAISYFSFGMSNFSSQVQGWIRDIRVWTSALTDEEVLSIPETTPVVVYGQKFAIFYAPLQATLVPKSAWGTSTYYSPSLTRGSAATAVDWEGMLRLAMSTEARFLGARRVSNLCPDSENANAASWATDFGTCTVTLNNISAPDGTLTADRLVFGGGGWRSFAGSVRTPVVGSKVRASLYVKGTAGQTINFWTRDANGAYSNIQVTMDGTWQRLTSPAALVSTHTSVYGIIGCRAIDGLTLATGTTIWVWGAQVEDVTGQADDTPGEYVSNGVLSAPWHGSAINGVKYFTTKNGNTVADGVITEATGLPITPANGGFSTICDADGPYGVFIEGQRTNSLTYSEDFSHANWTKTSTTISANAAVSPDGLTTADKIVEVAASAVHFVNQTVTAASIDCSFSVYLKNDTRQYAWVGMSDNTSGSVYAYVDLVAGTISQAVVGGGSWTNPIAGIRALPNGWYRVTVAGTKGAGTVANCQVKLSDAGTGGENPSYAGDTGKSLYAWGAQCETTAVYSSTYIPTTSAAVTRNADQLSYQTSGNYPPAPNAGTLVAEVMVNFNQSAARSIISDYLIAVATVNPLGINSGPLVASYDGTTQVTASGITLGVPFKAAATWGIGSVSPRFVYCDGNRTQGAYDGSIGVPNAMAIGYNATNYLFGTVRNVRTYYEQLTEAEIAAL
jgi:hypothetical protein